MEDVVELNHVSRTYRSKKGWFRRQNVVVEAVKDISFTVKEGEIFGILGQNGAGKTTIMKMLITLLAPTCGECKVLGCDTYGEEKKIRSRINFIFGGELGVYKRLSARDNLRYFCNIYLVPLEKREEHINKILELVDLTEAADRLVETYSKGMIQRLQIGRGLINDPDIVFMDEPTIGLDPIGARMLHDIITNLKRDGKTILLTTHYMYEADELCDRVAIINKGRLIALDSPKHLKELYEGDLNGCETSLEDVYVTLIKESENSED